MTSLKSTSLLFTASLAATFPALPVLAAGELVALGTKTGIGARALSLGEAFTAVADDYSALHYNAAGMTQLRKSEFAVNLGYGYLENRTDVNGGSGQKRAAESTRLNALTLVLTDGGPWALGLGYHSPLSFDDPLGYVANGRSYAYEARGQLDQYRVGLAYKASEAVRLGLAVSALSGTEQLQITDGKVERYLEEYSGFNMEPSLLLHFGKNVSVGASAIIFERLSLIDTWQQEDGYPLENHYSISHPFQTRLGMAFQSGLTQISLDWHGDYWSSNSYSLTGAAFEDGAFEYPNAHTFAIGLEQHVQRFGPVLRGGFQWQVSDEKAFEPEPQSGHPWRFNLGMGFSPAKDLSLDLGYQLRGSETWQSTLSDGPKDLRIAGQGHQVMGSMRFSF